MDRLSACYFCGAALDEALSTYPVVPTDLDPDPATQREVVLCAGCREKLATVVEPIVAVASEAESDAERGRDGQLATGQTPDEDQPSASAGRSTDDATRAVANGRSEPPEPRDHSTERGPDAEPDADESVESPSEAQASQPGGPADREDAERTTQSDQPDQPEQTDQSDHPDQPEQPDRPEQPEGRGQTDQPEQPEQPEREGQTDQPEQTDQDERTDQTVAEEPSLTALEYNRVVRLLQNREFPVDRQSFKTVALSAYDLSEREFEAVVDAAVERGIVAESGDQLVEPDGV